MKLQKKLNILLHFKISIDKDNLCMRLSSMSAYAQNKNKGGDYMKIYIVSSFDNEEHSLELYPFTTKEKAEEKQKELAEEFCKTLKLKHDNVKVDWSFGGAYVDNGEFYEYEIEIFEEEVK